MLNKRTMESLIKAGAFDSLGHPRKGLCLVFEEIVDRTLERRREHEAGVVAALRRARAGDRRARPGGFGDTRVPVPDTEFAKTQRLAFEKEMLGLYVSDHPLMGLEGALARLTDCTLAELQDFDADTPATVAPGFGARDRCARSAGWSPSSPGATPSKGS